MMGQPWFVTRFWGITIFRPGSSLPLPWYLPLLLVASFLPSVEPSSLLSFYPCYFCCQGLCATASHVHCQGLEWTFSACVEDFGARLVLWQHSWLVWHGDGWSQRCSAGASCFCFIGCIAEVSMAILWQYYGCMRQWGADPDTSWLILAHPSIDMSTRKHR